MAFDDNKITVLSSANINTLYAVTAKNPKSNKSVKFTVLVSNVTDFVAWTIGDSIFDFNDNFEDDMVQTILNESGYKTHFMDNIGGSTVYGTTTPYDLDKNINGITQHIEQGFYDEWQEPDLILIERSNNDAMFWGIYPDYMSATKTKKAVQEVCQYFTNLYPDTKFIWSTPLSRYDVSESKLNEMRDILLDICPEYGIDVYQIHKKEPFSNIKNDYYEYLIDGIHPNSNGIKELKQAFINKLAE